MSTVLMGLCWPLQMPPSAKAVLMSLADQANDAGVCWPAIGTICNRTCLSERTVQSAIGWLCQSGVLLVNRTPGRSTNYQINPAGFGAGTVGLFDAPARGDKGQTTPAAAAPRNSRTPQQLREGGANAAPTPANAAPRTVINRHRTVKGFDAGAIELPDWLEPELWQAWVQDRKERGKAITKAAARLQVGKLDKWRGEGITPRSVIEHCIAGGFQGLFPPRPDAKPGTAGGQGNTVPSGETSEQYMARVAAERQAQQMTPEQREASRRKKDEELARLAGLGIKLRSRPATEAQA